MFIDGNPYEILMEANVGCFKCREALFGIHGLFEDGRIAMEVTPENY